MERPCVRVPREEGEATRRRLDEAGLLDPDHDIVVEDGRLYLPVTDPGTVPADLDVVRHDVPARPGQETPADLLGWEPTYERLGDIVVLDEDDPDRAREAAEAVMASDVPAATVVNRASKVRGEHRVREFEVLAGDGTETVHREYGFEYLVDIAEVYFSPRLATERHLVAERVEAGEFAVDMFAGVGPFAVPFAAAGAEVVAVDVNPAAVRYCRENARRNGVADRMTVVEGDVREVADDHVDAADRLVMNLPHSAEEFLDAAVTLAGDDCTVHYYDIQHEDDPFGPGRRAIAAAAEPAGYDVEVVEERVVRSYAPHELNVRLDARLTR
ncbi:MAG: class I SAM-dependent methyltransferase family protein [Haloferacaceae archaeon]